MGVKRTVTAGLLAALLVLLPYTVVLTSARAEKLADLGIVNVQPRSCGEGQDYMLAQTADGTLYAFGENGHVVRGEHDPKDDSLPIVTYGTWSPDGEITMHPKTKHKVTPDDDICRDLFPAGA